MKKSWWMIGEVEKGGMVGEWLNILWMAGKVDKA